MKDRALAGCFLAASLGAASMTHSSSVSFANDVLPVLEARCVGCHMTGEEAGLLALAPKSAYASLVGVRSEQSPLVRVRPGSADESYLVSKLEGTQRDTGGRGARMPLGAPPLDETTRMLIKNWIMQGAPNN